MELIAFIHHLSLYNSLAYLPSQAGYWNFTTRVGCVPCACGEGSTSEVCDAVTGVCPCQPGVGGDDCSNCLNGFYNFTAQGCTGNSAIL